MLEYITADSGLSNRARVERPAGAVRHGRIRLPATEPSRMQPVDRTRSERRPAAGDGALPTDAGQQPPDRTTASSSSQSLTPSPLRIRVCAYLIGLVGTVLVDLWIHYAELVLGGTRGHSALANTSI